MRDPRIVYLVEGKRYSRGTLKEFLRESDVDALLRGCHLETLADGRYQLRFVGIIPIGDVIVCVLPKVYEDSSHLQNKFGPIIKALRRYADSGTQNLGELDYLNSNLNDPSCSLIAIIDFLLQDYFHNGLFYPEIHLRAVQKLGRVNWAATVSSLDPIFSGGRPLYDARVVESSSFDEDHLITSVHKWAVTRCAKVFAGVLGYDYSTVVGEEELELSELGSRDLILAVLGSALASAYADREIILLRVLISLVSGRPLESGSPSGVFGTREFERVWEAITKDYFRHQPLPGKPGDSPIPFPVWHLYGVGIEGKSTIIPDILHLDERARTLFLFDAKYYNLKFDTEAGRLTGEPGIKDIFKQFLYEQILAQKLDLKVVNAFLFPISEEVLDSLRLKGFDGGTPFEIAGRVEYVVFKTKYISVVLLPIGQFSEMFYRNRKISNSELDGLREALAINHGVD